ncbi:MAG: hypothetical protein EYC70_14590 [Planctomycetota bacterium]|nr:MAG: hypothetical protein EYC70_14590 [Planctomycetota bacterium]
MKALLALAILLAATFTLVSWRERASAWRELARAAAPAVPEGTLQPPQQRILRDALGAVTSAPSASAVVTALGDWGLAVAPAGAGLLEGSEAGLAARSELARWMEQPLPPATRARALRIEGSADGRSLQLRADFAGPAPECLRLLEHLLAAPLGRGYLADPQRVQLGAAGGGAAQLVLWLHVTPAQRFFEPRAGV